MSTHALPVASTTDEVRRVAVLEPAGVEQRADERERALRLGEAAEPGRSASGCGKPESPARVRSA